MSGYMETDCSKDCVPLPAPARHITYSPESDVVAVWNTHSLYLYKVPKLRDKAVSLVADFSIQQVLLSHTCAVCIDSNGAAHTFPLKFKSNSDKDIKIPFKPKAQGILRCYQLDEDIAVSLTQLDKLSICVHKLSTEFKTVKCYTLEFTIDIKIVRPEEIIVKASRNITDKNTINKVFKTDVKSQVEELLVVFSLDRYTVYGQVVDIKGNEQFVTPVKLFKCPSEIADLLIVNRSTLNIVIGLKSGTLLCLSCTELKLQAKVVHLNAAIYKIIAVNNDTFLYTDGIKMWMAMNVFSEKGLNYKQVFVTQPKDIIKCDTRIFCSTFSNLMYSFSLDTEGVLFQETISDGFASIPRDFTSSKEVVTEIMKEVNRNDDILKKIKSENTLMLAVALSKHSSALNQHLTFTCHIVNRYEDAVKDYDSFTLTRPLQKYFEPHTCLLLVSLQISSYFRQKFNEICSCLSHNLQLHIETVFGEKRETTTIPLQNKPLEKFNCLIPVQYSGRQLSMDVHLRIITPISSPLETRENFWTILYSMATVLNAEHFIRLDEGFNVTQSEKIYVTPEETVLEIAKRNYGASHEFVMPQNGNNTREWSCYIKLPRDFREILSNKNIYSKSLNTRTADYLVKKLGSNEFCNGDQTVYMTVCDSKVAFQTTCDDGENVLKMSGCEANVLCQLRQYFAGLLHTERDGRSEYIPQSHYTRVENLQRRLREVSGTQGASSAEILDVAHQFHKYTLGSLPL